MKCSTPPSRAASTACWISGRSTIGSISLGIALVAGRNRVPRPATGKIALRMGFMGVGWGVGGRFVSQKERIEGGVYHRTGRRQGKRLQAPAVRLGADGC